MTIAINPYLNFAGNTREAMTFYQTVFGGELTVSTFADFGVEGMPPDGVMHAALTTPNFAIMASDARVGDEAAWGASRVYLAVVGDEVDQLRVWFDALSVGGRVDVPLSPQAWGDLYGQLVDQYGLEWMFNIAAA